MNENTDKKVTAETCGDCGARVNVLAHSAGWHCPCGHYNCQSWTNHQIPWALPKYGPSRYRLQLASLVTSIWVWAVPRLPVLIPARIRKVVCHRTATAHIDYNDYFGGVRQRFWWMVRSPLRDLYWAVKTPFIRIRRSCLS